ncbi:biotin/lipoyl-binding carrier protein [Amycolatopsis jejuensis]|uniref:biotin/lipoyl-binding carrier protein n=1 Tax=Amycolatopsis jejuensis TaxID=330084 RepID=UPI00052774DA|nr:biotin/lipoyl-binding carrier protein [Amycolatopsis jejuensis]
MNEIRAELVATVLDITAEAGQRVSPGDPVLLLESMKMEIPVLAEASGMIGRIAVARGEVVREGTVLAVLVPIP